MERGREVERQKHTEGRRVKESGRGPETDRGKRGSRKETETTRVCQMRDFIQRQRQR